MAAKDHTGSFSLQPCWMCQPNSQRGLAVTVLLYCSSVVNSLIVYSIDQLSVKLIWWLCQSNGSCISSRLASAVQRFCTHRRCTVTCSALEDEIQPHLEHKKALLLLWKLKKKKKKTINKKVYGIMRLWQFCPRSPFLVLMWFWSTSTVKIYGKERWHFFYQPGSAVVFGLLGDDKTFHRCELMDIPCDGNNSYERLINHQGT